MLTAEEIRPGNRASNEAQSHEPVVTYLSREGIVVIDGNAGSVTQWAERLSVPRERLRSRLRGGIRQLSRLVAPGKIYVVKHGHARRGRLTTTYRVWAAMLERCLSPACSEFRNYGGRGITVCEAWRLSFAAFLSDMGERPVGLEIDRKDNDGDYEPGNCRWVTRKVNSQNKRTNHRVTIDGQTKTIAEWADMSVLSVTTIWSRLSSGVPTDNLLDPISRKTGRSIGTRVHNGADDRTGG